MLLLHAFLITVLASPAGPQEENFLPVRHAHELPAELVGLELPIEPTEADFGAAAAVGPDLDGNGRPELIVGAPGGEGSGAVWIFSVERTGATRQVTALARIEGETPALTGALGDGDRFGTSLTTIGDLDGDGIDELVVGAPGDETWSRGTGTVWVLFLGEGGAVRRATRIPVPSQRSSSHPYVYGFGRLVENAGDVDGNGVDDVAVASEDEVMVLRLGRTGGMEGVQFITDDLTTHGSLDDVRSLNGLGDTNDDGRRELLVHVENDHSFYPYYVLSLADDGSVMDQWSPLGINVHGEPSPLSSWADTVHLGDLDGDGRQEFGTMGNQSVSLWPASVLTFERDSLFGIYSTVSVSDDYSCHDTGPMRPVPGVADFDGDGRTDLVLVGGGRITSIDLEDLVSSPYEEFTLLDTPDSWLRTKSVQMGQAVAWLGDVNGDGYDDVAAKSSDPEGDLWILFLGEDRAVRDARRLDYEAIYGVEAEPCYRLNFVSLHGPGDLDGDGTPDMLLGMAGSLLQLYLGPMGEVRGHREILAEELGDEDVTWRGRFGLSLDVLERSASGTRLVVGAPGYSEGDSNGIWFLTLGTDGEPLEVSRIDHGVFEEDVETEEELYRFGREVAVLGDLDGDGIEELVVDSSVGLFVLFLTERGELRSHRRIHGLPENPDEQELVSVGDLNGDRTPDLVYSWRFDSVWETHILYLEPTGELFATERLDSAASGLGADPDPEGGFGRGLSALRRAPSSEDPEGATLLVGEPWRGPHGRLWFLDLAVDRRGRAIVRPGANDLALHAKAPPRLGRTLDTRLSTRGLGAGSALFFAFEDKGGGLQTAMGEVLVDVASVSFFSYVVESDGAEARLQLDVPADPNLLGQRLTLQALALTSPLPELSHALDLVIGE